MSDHTAGGLLMGWRLAEEVAQARPENPGPQWFTLLDIALNANDGTRRGWPGRDYLAARAKKSVRTIDRYIAALEKDGVLICVKRGGYHARPVYEIPVLQVPSTLCDTNDVAQGSHSPVDNSQPCATQTMSHKTPPDVRAANDLVRQNGGPCATQTMSHLPSVLPSVINGVAVVGGAVEGDASAPPASIQLPSGPWLGGSSPQPSAPGPPASPRGRRETDAERRRQAAALTAWEKANATSA